MNSDPSQHPKPDLNSDFAENFIEVSPQSLDEEKLEPLSLSSPEDQEMSATKALVEEVVTVTPQPPETPNLQSQIPQLSQQVEALQRQKQALTAEIEALELKKAQKLVEQTQDIEQALRQMVQEGLKELQQQKQTLEISVEQLERRRDRIREEMKTTFAGISQDLAIRVQGFKDYLVGSLQDLAAAAEQLELPSGETWTTPPETLTPPPPSSPTVELAPQAFAEQTRIIQQILDQYRKNPDYYGPPWQLRRTFEPIHAERVQQWFFKQGGRGTIRSLGSRLQNILVASAVISVINQLHGDRSRFLILANTPERLGEWRRGLQDCLGISRSDFGPERGVVLFESPEALIQKGERLVEDQYLPLVVIDETEEQINLSLLQFPLWLAFAPDPQQMSSYLY